MATRQFNSAIEIVSKMSKRKYDDAVEMETTAGKKFLDDVYEMLEELEKKPLGKALIKAIKKAGKNVIIYKDDKSGAGSAALPYPGTAANEIGRFIKLRQIPDNAANALKKFDPTYVPPSMANYGAEVHKVLKAANVNRDVAAGLLGIKREDLDEIELGRKMLPAEAYHRFAMAFYKWLTPGEGCSVGLRFDSEQVSTDDPAFIILGHELVHVWRMVTGMRVFVGGWEEEAMTTGLPPFLNMEFSENKLRIEHGKPVRTSYTALCGTPHYQMVSQFQGGKGIWPEHMRAWEEWKAANPKSGKVVKGVFVPKPIKLTKTSVFSSPIKHYLK